MYETSACAIQSLFFIYQSESYRSLYIDRVIVPYVLGMAIPLNFVPADWTKNAHPRKYDPAVISTFTVIELSNVMFLYDMKIP